MLIGAYLVGKVLLVDIFAGGVLEVGVVQRLVDVLLVQRHLALCERDRHLAPDGHLAAAARRNWNQQEFGSYQTTGI